MLLQRNHILKGGSSIRYISYIFIALFCFILFPVLSCAEETVFDNAEAIRVYKENRQNFVKKQQQVNTSFSAQQSDIETQLVDIENKIKHEDTILSGLNESIASSENTLYIIENIRTSLAMLTFPIAAAGAVPFGTVFNELSLSTILLLIFLSVTAFNLSLFLFFSKKELFPVLKKKPKFKIIVVAVATVLICSMAAPLFAGELSQREEVLQQLDFAEKVLSLSDHERFIAILESGVSNKVDLPELKTGDPLLKVYSPVFINTPKYYFTLAALYSHDGKMGKAVNAIAKLTASQQMASFPEADLIVVNSIKFLLKHKHTKLASTAIDNLGSSIKDVSLLLDLAVFLQEHGMQVSADKILSDVISRASTTKELVSLAVFFSKQQENDKSTEALSRALNRVGNIDDILLTAETAIKYNKDSVVEKLVQKVKSVSGNYTSILRVVDMFLKNGRQEDAILVFSEMISDVTRRTNQFSDKLLFLTEAALQRELLEQAVNAISKLSMYLGTKKYEMVVSLKSDLQSAKGLPDSDKITLPLFYGLLNEELTFNSRAEDVYVQTVMASLAKILQSYGYDLPDSLNDYHLLGRIWVNEEKGQLLTKLNKVYNVLEEQFLLAQEGRYQNELSSQEQELEVLRVAYATKSEKVSAKRRIAVENNRKVLAHTISIVAVAAFLMALFVSCILLSLQYCKKMEQHKTFGFVTRFVELTGWVRLFSILAVVSGLGSILIAQLFQIIQKTNENSNALLCGDGDDKQLLPEKPKAPTSPPKPVIKKKNEPVIAKPKKKTEVKAPSPQETIIVKEDSNVSDNTSK